MAGLRAGSTGLRLKRTSDRFDLRSPRIAIKTINVVAQRHTRDLYGDAFQFGDPRRLGIQGDGPGELTPYIPVSLSGGELHVSSSSAFC